MRVEKWIDEMVPMTDKVIGQEMAIVNATRNAVDVRKWVASKLMPNQYGDQPTSVSINNQTNVMVMSDERLRELQAVRQRMIQQQKGSRVGVAAPGRGIPPQTKGRQRQLGLRGCRIASHKFFLLDREPFPAFPHHAR